MARVRQHAATAFFPGEDDALDSNLGPAPGVKTPGPDVKSFFGRVEAGCGVSSPAA